MKLQKLFYFCGVLEMLTIVPYGYGLYVLSKIEIPTRENNREESI